MNRIVYITIVCLWGFMVGGCTHDEENRILDNSSQPSSQKYMDAVEHYIKNPYYISIQIVLSNLNALDNAAQNLMAPDAKCMPEILPEGEKLLLREPAKYLWELHQAYRNMRMDSGDLKFVVDSVRFDSNVVFVDGGCKLQAKYKLTVLYKEKVYLERWCQMWCLFPDKDRVDRIFTLEVTPLSYISPPEISRPVELQEKNEYVRSLIERATKGDAAAQHDLGHCYYSGKGVAQDYAKAVEWYYKSAEQGNHCAQHDLGHCYYSGKGVAQDYAKAVEWYYKSAEQGNHCAQHNLGNCYYSGKGVVQDYAKAVEWYYKSAEQGNHYAQHNLGHCYYFGKGVAQDYGKAVEWFKKSAEQDDDNAQYMLGTCYYWGKGFAQDYGKAVEWFKKSAEQGDDNAQYMLGICYYWGEGVAQDYGKAVEWFKKSAEQGDDDAQYMLGECYYWGDGVFMNYFVAVKWYIKAAKQGNQNAKDSLVRLGVNLCFAIFMGLGAWFGLKYIEKRRREKYR